MDSSKPVQAVLIDISGTLFIDNTPTPSAVDSLKRLRKADVKIKFVTNTTKESKRILFDRMKNLGFEVTPDEVFTSLQSAVDLIIKENLKPSLILEDEALEDFKEVMHFDDQPNCVVVGLAPSKFNRTYLNKPLRLLLGGAKLIAIHEGRYYKTSTGLSLGPGPFVKLLEYAAGVDALVVGKPNPRFFQSALDSLGAIDPKTAVMIGDDVIDDIGGAQALGMRGYLVQTGKYRTGDEQKIQPQPHRTVNTFREAVQDILTQVG